MTQPSHEYDPTEGTSPDLTGEPAETGLGDLADLPLEAEVADVVEQHAVVPDDPEEYRDRDAATVGPEPEQYGADDL